MTFTEQQVPSEIACLVEKAQSARVIVEIGTSHGGTLMRWLNMPNAECVVSIDLPGGQYGGVSQSEHLQVIREAHRRAIARGIEFYAIDGNSRSAETFFRLNSVLDGRMIDLLFIDGDHTYKGVKADFENFARFVHGLIAFHDIAESRWMEEQGVEVRKFWLELREQYPFEEYIDKAGSIEFWPQSAPYGFGGIGVIEYA